MPAPDLSTRQIALLFKDLDHYVFGASGTVFTNNFLSISIFYPALRQQGFPKFMRAGDLSKLEFQRRSTRITQELLLSILERYRPRKQFFFRSGHLYFYTIQSLTTVYFSVLSNNLSNWRYKQLFFAPTFYKKNSIFCRLKSRLVTSSLTCLWAFSRASVLIHQLTCGKSNQFTNLQTHSGLEGILSNYMYLSVEEEGFPVWTSLLLFTVCQTPSVNFDMSNLGPTVTHT